MYSKELDKLIEIAPNIATIRVYNKLTKMEQFKGGVVTSRKYIADELNLSGQYVCKVFEWLIKAEFIKESSVNGQTQFILNKLEELVDSNIAKIEEATEKAKSKQQSISKGGKTVTRMMVEGF